MLDLARALVAAAGPDAPDPVVTGAWRGGDVRHVTASPARAADRLGFASVVDFDDGMARFAAGS